MKVANSVIDNPPIGYSVARIDRLKEHEEVDEKRLEQLQKEIISAGALKRPIVVDKNTGVIIDGHHRFNVIKRLGFKTIPAIFVDYQSAGIQVRAWRDEESITKEDVINAALSGKKLPHRTSKHMIVRDGSQKHISAIQDKINIPLVELGGTKIVESLLELVGNTPVVRLNKLTQKRDATVLAKLEWYNIGGSLKDRTALYLIKKAEDEGRMEKGKTILEATSGNTGISLAMIAAIKGYKMAVVMPESASMERREIIKAYGTELILSSAAKGTGGAIELKLEMLRQNPDKYIDINQFTDRANILAHYETTGEEILEQTNGKLDMIIVGVGTAGTGVGVSQRVKEFNPGIKIVGIVPQVGASISGLRNPKEPNSTKLFDENAFDELIELGQEEGMGIHDTALELASKEGLFVGMSSAAIIYIALKKAKELGRGKTIVAILPDNGNKYLSTNLFSY